MNRLQASEKRYANLEMLWIKRGEENTRLRELLRRCEWDYSGHCLICGNKQDIGHAEDCELAKELGDG
jgi:hypothetical protein